MEEALNTPIGQVPKELLIKLASGTEEEQKQVMQYCYNLIENLLRKYLDMREEYYNIVTLWVMGTYIHKSFDTYGFLYLNAMKSSGKTRLLKLITSLSYNGEMIGLPSEAAIFRSAENSTLCIDEFESVGNNEKNLIRELLNSAYKKGQTIKRYRKVSTKGVEDYQAIEYNTFCPIAIANINGMDEVLSDRCITMILERSNHPTKTRISEREGFRKEFRNVLEVIKLCMTESYITQLYDGWDEFCLKKEEGMLNNTIQENSVASVYSMSHLQDIKREKVDEKEIDLTSVHQESDKIGDLDENKANMDYFKNPPNNNNLHTIHTIHYINTTKELYKRLYESNINGRPSELYMPLLFIAYKTKADYFNQLLDSAIEFIERHKDDGLYDNNDMMLLDFLSKSHYNEIDWINTSNLCTDFKQFQGFDDKFVNSKWMGIALNRLNLISERSRKADGSYVRLKIAYIRDRMVIYNANKAFESLDTPKTQLKARKDAKTELMDRFNQLAKESPKNDVLHEEWYEAFKSKYSYTEFGNIVEKMLKECLIYEPRRGYYMPC